MPCLAKTENMKTKEQQAAELVVKLEGFFDESGDFAKLADRVKAVESLTTGLDDIDVKSVMAEVDKIKAAQEEVTRAIRSSRKGGYVSGMEDVNFNLSKALVAHALGDWDIAPQEKELMDQAREKRRTSMKASHVAGDDNLGGNFIPDQVIADVIGAIYTRSAFVNLAESGQTRISVLDGLSGGHVRVPKFEGGVIAYWIGEEDEYAESVARTEDITMNPKKLGALIRITDTMEKLGGFGFESLIRRDMERAMAKKLDYTIMYGSGSNNMPRGLVNMNGLPVFSAQSGDRGVLGTDALGAAPFQADWDGAELDFDGLDDMMLQFEEDDVDIDGNFSIVSSPRYFRRLKKLKVANYSSQATQQPYLLGMPMLTDARLQELIGDFAWTSQITSNKLPGASINAPTDSTAAKMTDVVMGDLSEILLGRWFGLELVDDRGQGKGFTSDHRYVKIRMYADIAARQLRRLSLCPDAQVRD